MAEHDGTARFRVELPAGSDRDAVLSRARSVGVMFGASECQVRAAPLTASRAARRLAPDHPIGLVVRTRRSVHHKLPDVLLRGEAEEVRLFFGEHARHFSCGLSVHRTLGIHELWLSGPQGASNEETDAFYSSRIEACRRLDALDGDPPRVTHPLVITTVKLRAGSFGRLAIDPVITDGFEICTLAATVGVDHGAELAQVLLPESGEFLEYTIRLRVSDEAAVASLTGCFAPDTPFDVEWTGKMESFLAGPPMYSDTRVDGIRVHAAAGDATLEIAVKFSRPQLSLAAGILAERVGCPVTLLRPE